MPILRSIVQIIVALGLLNVWLLHFRQRTAYRGGNAGSMRDEFTVYGMPPWSVYVVGALKVGIAICLLAGLWIPAVIFPASLILCVLMVGALAMHAKVHDPMKKSLPALAMLAFSIFLVLTPARQAIL
jgi:uncharacterized membrane protein YphA (DoxX/SURF4 family)